MVLSLFAQPGNGFRFVFITPFYSECSIMRQNNFNRAVAKATGESVETIQQRGFVLLTPMPIEREAMTKEYEELLKACQLETCPSN